MLEMTTRLLQNRSQSPQAMQQATLPLANIGCNTDAVVAVARTSIHGRPEAKPRKHNVQPVMPVKNRLSHSIETRSAKPQSKCAKVGQIGVMSRCQHVDGVLRRTDALIRAFEEKEASET